MGRPIRTLIVEDRLEDAELLIHELKRGGYEPEWTRVETEEDFLEGLDPPPDLILADYNLPGFSGSRALDLLVSSGADVPFIVVSGAVGEETAVDLVKRGAADYLLKDRLERLSVAVERAVEERRLRQEKAKTVALLGETSERYRSLVENIPAATYVLVDRPEIALGYSTIFVSPQIEDLLGFGPDAFTEDSEFEMELIHPEDRERVVREFREAMAASRPSTAEYRMINSSGETVWIRDEAVPIFRPGARPYWQGVILDVTDRVEAAEASRASEARYRALFESMLEGLAYCRMIFEDGEPRDFVYLEVNSKFAELTGLNDVVGKRVTEVIPGIRESNPELLEVYGRVSLTGNPEWFETYLEGIGWLSISVYSPGRERFVAVFENVTERKQAQEAVEESLSLLRATIEATADGILVVDDARRVLTFNERFLDMWRIPRELAEEGDDDKLLAHVLDQLAEPEAFLEKVRELYATPEAESNDEIEFSDGRLFERYSRPQISVGKSNGRVWSFRDVTARRDAEKALRAQEVTRGASQAKTEFLSRMSHEIRTPLNAVLGFAQLLEMEELGSGNEESVNQILAAGHHLLELVDEVLDISRIEAGSLKLSTGPVLVAEAVSSVVDLLRPLCTDLGVRVTISGGVDPEIHALADSSRLRQVLLNLVSNAIKYNDPGGAVAVSTSEGDGRVRIDVSDTGPGISEPDLHRIWDPFERLAADQKGIQGSGLGLPVCKRLAEAMGGTVSVTSEIGRGSTFTVDLPRAGKA